MTFSSVSVRADETISQLSYPRKSENAIPPGDFSVYLSNWPCAKALAPRAASATAATPSDNRRLRFMLRPFLIGEISPLEHSGKSEDLLDDVNRPIGANLPHADGEQTVEERVLGRRRFETWRCAQIAVRVIAHPPERHVNQRAVVSLERDAQIE